MSKLHDDSDPLSMELMRKFREGTLSAEEEARLNALQAQDPFLADALEGMAVVSNGDDFVRDVNELRGRIQQRTRTKKSLRLYWLPVAASLVLLIGAFFVIYTYVQPSDTSTLISKEVEPSATAPEESTEASNELSAISMLPPEDLADTPSLNENQSPQSLAMVQLPTKETALSSAFSQEPAHESMTESAAGSAAVADEVPQIMSEVEAESFDENFSLARKQSAAKEEQNLSPAAFSARSKALPATADTSENRYTISGKVIDQENGEPVPGANVLVKGTNLGTVTNLEGDFSLSLTKQHEQLLISSIGYETSESEIEREDTILVTLHQDIQALSEVVVIGYAVQERRDLTGSVSSIDKKADQGNSMISAQPKEGMRAFKQYLSDNQKYPADWKEDDKAVVKLSFLVEPHGDLSNFTIEKSAGAWLDQEAIRLIQEGPDWKAATNNGQAIAQEVKLRIRFKK